MLKRRLRIACLCLLVGAVVNVLVAWGCQEWSPDSREIEPLEPAWLWSPPPGWPDAENRDVEYRLGVTVWSAWRYRPDEYHGQKILRFGWPLRSLSYDLEHLLEDVPEAHFVVRSWGEFATPWPVRNPPLTFPWRPLPLGTALNSLLYALVTWGAVRGPLQLHRNRRRRRGLCPACAYPVGAGAVCSECGQEHGVSGSHTHA